MVGRPKGLPKTGGRPKGVGNKATADIKAAAREYSADALKELARLAVEAESEPARVAAIKEILDRAYGKATQPISGDKDEAPIRIDLSGWDDDMLRKVAATSIDGD